MPDLTYATEKELEQVEAGAQLEQFRSSPGFEALRQLLTQRISDCFEDFLNAKSDEDLRSAAHAGRAIFSIMAAFGESIDASRELAASLDRAAQGGGVHASNRAVDRQAAGLEKWDRPITSHPRGRMG